MFLKNNIRKVKRKAQQWRSPFAGQSRVVFFAISLWISKQTSCNMLPLCCAEASAAAAATTTVLRMREATGPVAPAQPPYHAPLSSNNCISWLPHGFNISFNCGNYVTYAAVVVVVAVASVRIGNTGGLPTSVIAGKVVIKLVLRPPPPQCDSPTTPPSPIPCPYTGTNSSCGAFVAAHQMKLSGMGRQRFVGFSRPGCKHFTVVYCRQLMYGWMDVAWSTIRWYKCEQMIEESIEWGTWGTRYGGYDGWASPWLTWKFNLGS